MLVNKPLRSLRPYQQKFLDDTEDTYRIPMLWRMRTGKSIPIIRWITGHAERLNHRPRVLIVSNKTILISWAKELELEGIDFQVFTTKNKDVHHWMLSPVWAITNYETLIANDTYIHELPWDVVILDESTKIKNINAKITRIFLDKSNFPMAVKDEVTGMTYKSPFPKQLRAILTGSPAEETPLEYVTQMFFLYGEWLGYKNYWHLKKDLFQKHPFYQNRQIPKPGVRIHIANFLRDNAFQMSHREAGMDLPNVYQRRYVEMPPKVKEIYEEFEKNWCSDILEKAIAATNSNSSSLKQLATQWAAVAQNYLHQLACGYPKRTPDFSSNHKSKELLYLLHGELRQEKVIIWCRYSRDIKELYALINKKGIKRPVCITGDDSNEKVKAKLDDFDSGRKNPHYKDVAICQVKKAYMGMDLSVSDTQIFFSRPWSAIENTQCSDRLIHPLKKDRADFSSLLTIDIITKDTIDEDLIKALIDKKSETQILKYFIARVQKKYE